MTTTSAADAGSPILSCIVASYNHASYVTASLEACLRIPVEPKEVIVIDDGSTDDSVSLIRNHIASSPSGAQVRVVSRTNHGLVSSLNHALTLARGEFIYMVASDDLAIARGVATLVDELRRHPAAGFAVGNGIAFTEDHDPLVGRRVYGAQHAAFFALEPQARDAAAFSEYPQPILIQCSVFRRRALAAVGDFDPTLMLDDYPLFIRLLRAHPRVGEDVLFLPEVLVGAYRQHANNAHRDVWRQLKMMRQVVDRLCPEGERTDVLGRLHVHYALQRLRRLDMRDAVRLLREAGRFGWWRASQHAIGEVRAWRRRARTRAADMTLPHPVPPRV